MFEVMAAICGSLFLFSLALILVRNFGQWNRNNRSPRLTMDAVVTEKRQDTVEYRHFWRRGIRFTTSDTFYYVTFQFESGDRLELHVPRNQFGYMVEGDRGRLSFQGTRFLGFERT